MKKNEYFTVIAFILMAVICLFTLGSCSNDTDDGGENDGIISEFFDGLGIESNPYIIDSLKKLQNMRDLVNDNTDKGIYCKAHYLQTENINLNNMEWVSIGTSLHEFIGVYNGGNKTISNLKTTGNNMGLFNYLGENSSNNYSIGAEIKNLGINGVDIKCTGSAGVIAGHVENGAIINCWVLGGSITADGNCCGGITGYMWGNDAIVESCYADGLTINAPNDAETGGTGGVVGLCYGGKVLKSYADAEVSGKNNTGGVVGNFYMGSVERCFSKGKVTSSGGAWANAGGITGRNYGSPVSNCYSTSDVTADLSAGGVVGFILGLVEYCYARGTITSTAVTDGAAGGIGGSLGTNNIQNCIALNPKVSAFDSNKLGRIVGDMDLAGVGRNNYVFNGLLLYEGSTLYTPTTTGDEATDINTKHGYSTALYSLFYLEHRDHYDDATKWYNNKPWDFDKIWEIKGNNLPILKEFDGVTQ